MYETLSREIENEPDPAEDRYRYRAIDIIRSMLSGDDVTPDELDEAQDMHII